jgi:hypothetical protein
VALFQHVIELEPLVGLIRRLPGKIQRHLAAVIEMDGDASLVLHALLLCCAGMDDAGCRASLSQGPPPVRDTA